jgi:hypothetical protein
MVKTKNNLICLGFVFWSNMWKGNMSMTAEMTKFTEMKITDFGAHGQAHHEEHEEKDMNRRSLWLKGVYLGIR